PAPGCLLAIGQKGAGEGADSATELCPALATGTGGRRFPMTGPARIVVVGAGLAGLRTIEELRARGCTDGGTLGGAEARPPYDRPPLSKKFLTGELDDTSLRADLDS